MRRLRTKLLAPAIIILLIAIPMLYVLSKVSNPAEAAWFDDNWKYRKSIEISSHTSPEANVYINLAGANALDTSDTTKFQSDCGDLRFTTLGGDLLAYYIVSGCGTATTVVHVFFESFPAGAQTIYYYYGNPSASNGFSSADFSTEASNYTIGTQGSEENAPSPSAYWKFDEGYGTTAQDSSSSNYDISFYFGSPTWQTEDQCISGKCIRFPTDSDCLRLTAPSGNLLNFGSNDFTISGWYKIFQPASLGSGIIGNYPHSGENGDLVVGIRDNTTDLFLSHKNTSGAGQSFDYTYTRYFGQWTYISWVKSGSTMYLYLNGKQVRSWNITISFDVDFYDDYFYIGNTGWSPGVMNNLTVDEVKIYPYARSAEQVKLDYNNGLAGVGSDKGSSAVLGSSIQKYLSEGLTGHWKMDEATWSGVASEALDSSGNGNHGTAQGTTGGKAYTTGGKFGNGGYFDGVDDWINVPSSTSINPQNSFTISAWVKPNSFTGSWRRLILSQETYLTSGFRMGYAVNTGQPLFWTTQSGGNITLSGTQNLTLNQWNHLVITYASQQAYIYLNGTQIGFTTGTYTTGSNDLKMGTVGGGENLPGNLDEVSIYNRALSPKEVRDLYNWAPGPRVYYELDEGTGSTANDNSGNNNTGTVTGSWVTGKYGKGIKAHNNGTGATIGNNFIFGRQSFTLMSWVKSADIDGGQSRIMGKDFTTPGGYFWVNFGNGNVYIECRDADSVGCGTGGFANGSPASKNIADNQWHHVAIAVDRENNRQYTYIDGVLYVTGTQSFTNVFGDATSTNTFRIGFQTSGATLSLGGDLDDVRIYNYARTQKQIVEDMNAGHPSVGSPVGSALAHYELDEGYGTTADNSGSGGSALNGTITGATWTNDGKFGKALNFDGSGDRVTKSHTALVPENITVSGWFKANSFDTDTAGVISAYWWDRWGTIRIRTSGYLQWQWVDSTQTVRSLGSSAKSPISNNTWYHVTATFDKATQTARLYLNGKQVDSISAPDVEKGSNSGLYIGTHYRDSAYYDFNGLIDEVKIYNYALTEDEVKLDYNRGAALVMGAVSTESDGSTPSFSSSREYCIPGDTATCNPPVAEWKFEEKQGGYAYDTSGNGNTATFVGTPVWTQGKIGSALNFDDSADYLTLTGVAVGSTWTVSAWSKFPLAVTGTYRTLVRQGSGVHHILVNVDGLLGVYDGSFSSSGFDVDTLPTGWHHLTAVGNGGSTVFYIDGKHVGTSAQQVTTSIMQIGGIGAQNWGTVDQMRVYNYARTPAQVAWDYNRGAPVGHWRFDEGQGTTAHDASGNGNHGNINIGGSGSQTSAGTITTAGTAWGNGATGKLNYSLNFDGTDDRVVIPHNGIFNFSTNIDFSASFWVKATGNGLNKVLMNKGNGNNTEQGWRINTASDGRSYLRISDGTNQQNSSQVTYQDGNWHLLTFTVDRDSSTGMKAYKDGVLIGSTNPTSVGSIDRTSLSLAFMANGDTTGGSYNGQIDDFRIYNYALTPTQIKTLYNNGAATFAPQTGSP